MILAIKLGILLAWLWYNAPEYFVKSVNPLSAKFARNRNFHPLEAVSRWRDPQPQVSENYPELTK